MPIITCECPRTTPAQCPVQEPESVSDNEVCPLIWTHEHCVITNGAAAKIQYSGTRSDNGGTRSDPRARGCSFGRGFCRSFSRSLHYSWSLQFPLGWFWNYRQKFNQWIDYELLSDLSVITHAVTGQFSCYSLLVFLLCSTLKFIAVFAAEMFRKVLHKNAFVYFKFCTKMCYRLNNESNELVLLTTCDVPSVPREQKSFSEPVRYTQYR